MQRAAHQGIQAPACPAASALHSLRIPVPLLVPAARDRGRSVMHGRSLRQFTRTGAASRLRPGLHSHSDRMPWSLPPSAFLSEHTEITKTGS